MPATGRVSKILKRDPVLTREDVEQMNVLLTGATGPLATRTEWEIGTQIQNARFAVGLLAAARAVLDETGEPVDVRECEEKIRAGAAAKAHLLSTVREDGSKLDEANAAEQLEPLAAWRAAYRDQIRTIATLENIVRSSNGALAPEIKSQALSEQNIGEEGREKLFRANMFFAAKIGARMTAEDFPLEVAIPAAYGGLLSAVEEYNSRCKVRLTTFAGERIVESVMNERSKTSVISVGRTALQRARDYERREERLKHALQRTPSREEIFASLALPGGKAAETTLAALQAIRPILSVDDAAEENSITCDNPSDNLLLREKNARMRLFMRKMLVHLNERSAYVLRERVVEGRTLREIGKELGISRERVRQMQENAVATLQSLAQNSPKFSRLLESLRNLDAQ